MQLGWIDFSERDRRKAIDIIHLLQLPGAMDELGIGSVRDAFANVFFPGTSTIQTRAKYFFIVPYAIKACCDNPRYQNLKEIRKAIDDLERDCALRLKAGDDTDGVIGVDSLPQKWVVRKPSSIYWNGIRTLGIFTNRYMSIDECIRESLLRRSNVSASNWTEDGEENEQDDKGAGRDANDPLWNLELYDKKWMNDLKIKLSKDEAVVLHKTISSKLKGTLYQYILDHKEINLQQYDRTENPFRALYEDIKDDVSDELRHLMLLAIRTDSLIYFCRILFNAHLHNDKSEEAAREWELWNTPEHLAEVRALDLNEVFTALRINDRGVKSFLIRMQTLILNGDLKTAKSKLEEWEVHLKGEKRSKLRNRDSNDKPDDKKWIGGYHLDYRLRSAARIIRDIYDYAKEGQSDV